MPETLIDRVNRISTGIRLVLDQHQLQTEELTRINQENARLKEKNHELENKIRQLEEQVLILRSSVAPLDDKSKKEFEKRINEYLLTIRKCISLLQN